MKIYTILVLLFLCSFDLTVCNFEKCVNLHPNPTRSQHRQFIQDMNQLRLDLRESCCVDPKSYVSRRPQETCNIQLEGLQELCEKLEVASLASKIELSKDFCKNFVSEAHPRMKSDLPTTESELQPATYCIGVFGTNKGFGIKSLVGGISEHCNDGERRRRQFCQDPKMDEKYADVKKRVC